MKKLFKKIAAMAWGSLGAVAMAAVPPVTFFFQPAVTAENPLAREISAEVITPSRKTLRLPAYYAGEGRFAVRARAEEKGEYRLGAIHETRAGKDVAVECPAPPAAAQTVSAVEPRPQVTIAKEAPERFRFANGGAYFPLGANLAWADADRVGWYAKAFQEFAGAGLNWTRVWMASWGGLNLDWLPEDMGKSPRLGQLDERVARNWDAVLAAAAEQGVYVQVVLQHHGQYSSQVNSNWAENPWNAANAGGFLQAPGEFFTSAEAKRLTKQKYRFAVARWGYSPAVLAWELFNEVHWVDALRLEHDEAAVARWHDEMAAYIRSVDAYGHLVTTSTEELGSPIYRSLDYFQPHLYAVNLLAASHRLDPQPAGITRPAFYGEQGDDNAALDTEQKESGVALAPVVWASLMGDGGYPAQAWKGDQLLAKGRIGEFRAIARFVKATALAERSGLKAFSPAVAGEPAMPLAVEAGDKWHRRPPVDFRVPTDGRQVDGFATMPGILVGSPLSVADGYADHATLRVNYPRATTATLRIASVGEGGAGVQIEVDGKIAAERSFAAGQSGAGDVSFAVAAGERTIVIRNVGQKDWFELSALDLGLKTPALTAVGRRNDDFVAAWVWNRSGVFALAEPAAVRGTVRLEAVPAGKWRVTWWDSLAGVPDAPVTIVHAGGELELPTPPIRRHAAVALERTTGREGDGD